MLFFCCWKFFCFNFSSYFVSAKFLLLNHSTITMFSFNSHISCSNCPCIFWCLFHTVASYFISRLSTIVDVLCILVLNRNTELPLVLPADSSFFLLNIQWIHVACRRTHHTYFNDPRFCMTVWQHKWMLWRKKTENEIWIQTDAVQSLRQLRAITTPILKC